MSEATLVTRYGWKEADVPCSCAYLVPEIMQIVARLGAKRILDLGSGNGALCGLLKKQSYAVAGCEYDKNGVDIARAAYPDIPFYNFGVQDDPAQLLATERKFDLVVSTEVIEHLFSPHHLPIFAGRVLTDDSHLVVSTPYHGYLKNLALSLADKWDAHHGPLWHGGHIKFWSRRTLTRLLEEHGFEVLEFHGVGRIPYLWKSMILVCRKQRRL
jgi:2-polyprenyl-3-methyl-5-hydroxy-6-metoxy-1,4-benzoquinol methylase